MKYLRELYRELTGTEPGVFVNLRAGLYKTLDEALRKRDNPEIALQELDPLEILDLQAKVRDFDPCVFFRYQPATEPQGRILFLDRALSEKDIFPAIRGLPRQYSTHLYTSNPKPEEIAARIRPYILLPEKADVAPATLKARYDGSMTLKNTYGMHARPAAFFAKLVQNFEKERSTYVDITVEHNGNKVSGKSIMGLMTLEASRDSTIKVKITGEGAEELGQRLSALVASKFDED